MSNLSVLVKILLSLIIMTLPGQVNAQTILDSDNFDDGNDIGWTHQHESGAIDYSSNWTFPNGMYGLKVNSTFVVENSFWGDDTWTDYQVNFDMLTLSGSDKNFIFRYQDRSALNTYNRWYELHVSGSQAYLAKVGYGIIGNATPVSISYGQTYNWRASLKNAHIKIEYKNSSQTEYITVFDIEDETSDPILNGKIGIRIGAGSAYPVEVYFDNIVVTDLRPEPTPTPTPEPTPTPTPEPTPEPTPAPTPLPIQHFSQIDQQWADTEYDHASNWAKTGSIGIKNWGCALTSAAMVLGYHNYPITPQALNQYLIDNQGYNAWGGVIWSYFTKYAKQTYNATTDKSNLNLLEFSYPEYSASELQTDLKNNQPDILKLLVNPATEGNHFVVATGPTYSDPNIQIQDPLSTDSAVINLTHQYPDKPILKLARFTPSHTDLSYLWVFGSNSLSQLSLTQNQQVPDETDVFTDGGVKDSGSDEVSPTYQVISLPKPESGSYQINILGSKPGANQIDTAFFDTKAQDFRQIQSIYSDPNTPRQINLNLNRDDAQKTSFTPVTSMPIILKVANHLYGNPRHLVLILKQIGKLEAAHHYQPAIALTKVLIRQLDKLKSAELLVTELKIYQQQLEKLNDSQNNCRNHPHHHIGNHCF